MAPGRRRKDVHRDDDWASSFRDSTRHAVDALWNGDVDDLLFGATEAREILAFALSAYESTRRDGRVDLREFSSSPT